MRVSLLWRPGLALERLAATLAKRRRLRVLRGTPAAGLSVGHIESLELLQISAKESINTVYDIGAHVGTWSLLASTILPNAFVEAFEPLPAHAKDFERNLSDSSRVRLHRVALGSKSQSAEMRVLNHSDASSFLPVGTGGRQFGGFEEVSRVRVQLTSLDEYCVANDLAPADLLKLDVQGFELEVLSGAELALRSARALIVEVSFIEFYVGQCSFAEVCAFLHARGFELRALGVSTPLGKSLTQSDALFMRRESRT